MTAGWEVMDILIMLAGALVIDLVLGEFPRPVHPVECECSIRFLVG